MCNNPVDSKLAYYSTVILRQVSKGTLFKEKESKESHPPLSFWSVHLHWHFHGYGHLIANCSRWALDIEATMKLLPCVPT